MREFEGESQEPHALPALCGAKVNLSYYRKMHARHFLRYCLLKLGMTDTTNGTEYGTKLHPCFLLKALCGSSSQGNFLLLCSFQLFEVPALADSTAQFQPSSTPVSAAGQPPHSRGKPTPSSPSLFQGCTAGHRLLLHLISVPVTILNPALCRARVVRAWGAALTAPWGLSCLCPVQHHRFPSFSWVPESPRAAFWHDSLVVGSGHPKS